jgi:hypothetical protein
MEILLKKMKMSLAELVPLKTPTTFTQPQQFFSKFNIL